MKNLNALAFLKDTYKSDDEDCEYEDNETETPCVKKPRMTKSPDLPVPEELLNFLTDETENTEIYDEPDLHEGRIRSFPHERGNWATCLYVPIRNVESMTALCNKLLPHVRTVDDFHSFNEFHVTLSKTVVLRHHWIQLFVDGIRKEVEKFNRFYMDFEELEVFLNDERTRTFLALKVKLGYDMLLQLVKCSDKNLSEFNLPGYYENPSFHASILWCVGDKQKDLTAMKSTLQKHFQELKTQNPHSWSIDVNEIHCKIGNRLHRFNLLDIT